MATARSSSVDIIRTCSYTHHMASTSTVQCLICPKWPIPTERRLEGPFAELIIYQSLLSCSQKQAEQNSEMLSVTSEGATEVWRELPYIHSAVKQPASSAAVMKHSVVAWLCIMPTATA